jgi:hypothetical protein
MTKEVPWKVKNRTLTRLLLKIQKELPQLTRTNDDGREYIDEDDMLENPNIGPDLKQCLNWGLRGVIRDILETEQPH